MVVVKPYDGRILPNAAQLVALLNPSLGIRAGAKLQAASSSRLGAGANLRATGIIPGEGFPLCLDHVECRSITVSWDIA